MRDHTSRLSTATAMCPWRAEGHGKKAVDSAHLPVAVFNNMVDPISGLAL
jgi:hypothetical protein